MSGYPYNPVMLEKSTVPLDPERIADRVDFAAALTALREAAGLTVRDLAKRAAVPTATVSGYLSGRHLPNPSQPGALLAVLAACGVVADEDRGRWLTALRRVRQAPGRRSAAGPSPYPGLASFQPEDADFFFGRADLVADIQAMLGDIRAGRSEQRIAVLTGPSGSGKSSVLRAGIVPSVVDSGVAPLVMAPGDDPAATLARVLARHCGVTADEAAGALTGDGDALAELLAARPILLVVDQAEEMFTACTDPTRRAAFLEMLRRLTGATRDRPLATAILALRADFYAAAADEPVLLPALRHAQIVVGAMNRAELTEAIVAPAAAVGLHVEDALVQTLLEDLAPRDRPGSAHDRGALPLLAHALHATWLVARRGRMTVDDYLSTGGIAGAVERTAESVWGDLDDDSRELARRIFLRLVFVDDESMVTRRRARLEELHGLEPQGESADGPEPGRPTVTGVVELFADARLLTLRTDTVEISHEALIGAWQRLNEWIDADRHALRTHRQLSESARTWDQAGRDESYLLRSGRLVVVGDLLESGRVTLNDVEQAFVDASTQQLVERRDAERRQRLRLRVALAAVAVLALVTSGLSVFALRAESSADQRATEATAARDDAQSRELAIAADRLRESDPALAAQLSLTAYRIAPTVDARSALLDTTALPLPTRIPSQEGPTFIAVDRARSVLAVTQAISGGVTLWSTATPGSPELLATLTSAQAEVQQFSVAISPDGQQLAAGDAAGLVERWNIADPRHPRALPGPGVVFPSGVLALTFSPDGDQLAAGGEGGVAQRWTVPDTGEAVALPPIPGAALVSALAWAPDGRTLWVGDGDGNVTERTLAEDRVTLADPDGEPLVLHTGPAVVSSVAVSPDGETLAAGTKRGELHVWRHDGRAWTERDQPPAALAGWVDTLAFSPDGTDLALGATGNDIRVLDAGDLSEQAAMVAPGPVTAVAYTGDGALATGSSDGFTRLWPVPGVVIGPVGDTVFDVAVPARGRIDVGAAQKVGGLLTYDVSHRSAPVGTASPLLDAGDVRLAGILAASPDGRLAAMGAAGGEVQLWDTTDPAHPHVVGTPFAAAGDFVNGLAISGDGSMLAVGSDASVVDLWDVSDPANPTRLAQTEQAGGLVASVAFQPGEKVLAAATTDGNVRLWDIAEPTHPKQIADLTGLTGYALSASFSRDGTLLAAGGSGREIRLWDVHDPLHITPVGSPITGPANDIGMVAFDPAGPRLAAATYGGVVWQWDVRDPAHPALLSKLRAAGGVLYALAWSPDGATLSAGGSAQKVWTWTADAEAAEAEVCAAAGTGITQAEWALYVQERAYAPPCG